jgi:hypothetical protein
LKVQSPFQRVVVGAEITIYTSLADVVAIMSVSALGAPRNSTLVETVSLDFEDFNESFLTCSTCLCKQPSKQL